MASLYIITGPAGVGKSTVSKLIAESKKKSALIEGDEIYSFVKGGYISAWLDGNHLEVCWENIIDIIKNFLDKDYDVVFNYIVRSDKLEKLKENFSNVKIKFIVLMVDEATIVKRDKERPLDCQMGERSIKLLNEFNNENYDKKYILNTTNLSIEETIKEIEKDERFNLYR
ncbi:MAG TPA: AAA family ATPase [Bacilli bacterium]|nr:AAA family ATPase [Bacilli bacterium]